jgi:hypothetical protein
MDDLWVLVSYGDWRATCVAMFVESKLMLSTLKDVERRLLREYLDLPGLSLTLAQAARLLCVDAPTSEVVLNDLVNSRCLALGESGTYMRDAGFGDLELWKRLVRNRLADGGKASPSPIKAVSSVERRPRRRDHRFAEPVEARLGAR